MTVFWNLFSKKQEFACFSPHSKKSIQLSLYTYFQVSKPGLIRCPVPLTYCAFFVFHFFEIPSKISCEPSLLDENLIWQAYSLCNLYFWKYFPNFSSETDCLATVFQKTFEKLENKQCAISVLPGSDQFVLCLVGNCTTNYFQIVKNTWTFPNFPKTDLARENPSPRSFFYTMENNQNTFRLELNLCRLCSLAVPYSFSPPWQIYFDNSFFDLYFCLF
jgi:hypothetical protein